MEEWRSGGVEEQGGGGGLAKYVLGTDKVGNMEVAAYIESRSHNRISSLERSISSTLFPSWRRWRRTHRPICDLLKFFL